MCNDPSSSPHIPLAAHGRRVVALMLTSRDTFKTRASLQLLSGGIKKQPPFLDEFLFQVGLMCIFDSVWKGVRSGDGVDETLAFCSNCNKLIHCCAIFLGLPLFSSVIRVLNILHHYTRLLISLLILLINCRHI